MRDMQLFFVLFWLFVVILIISIITNVIRGKPIVGVIEFVLMVLLTFLVLGDEWVNFKITKTGIEIQQSVSEIPNPEDTDN